MNAAEKIPGLMEAARASFESLQPGDHTITFERAEHEKMAAELAALKQDPTMAEDLVRIIYPGAVPADVAFYPPLLQFALYLDFTDQANEIVGIVWNQAFTHLDANQTEAVLLALPQVNDSLSHGLSALPYLVGRRQIPAATMLQLGETIAKVTANNFCGPGLDRALETFTERRPNEAMELLSTFAPTEGNLGILGIMLGRLRTGPHATSLAAPISQFEEKFRTGAGLFDRNVFYQSYYQEAFSSQLTVAEVDKLCATADANGPDDVHNLIVLLAIWMNHPRLNPPVFRRAYEWLEKRVSPTISEIGKAHVAQLASFFNRKQYQWSDEWRPNIAQLVVSILPIEPEHAGIWAALEMYLGSLLPAEPATFQMVVRELATRSGRSWLKVLKKHPGMTHLENQMKTTRQDDLIGELCLSPNRVKRDIGLYFFDELDVLELPNLGGCDPRICWILLHEVICQTISGQSAVRCLLSLVSEAGRLGSEFTRGLKIELLTQAKNYPGACGEMFAKNKDTSPLLQEAVAAQEKYFQALARTKTSPVFLIQIPGYQQAMEEFRRRFSNEIHEVRILYGLSWSTFQGDQLGAATELQPFSHKMELPRLELIEPEEAQLRRLHASTDMDALERDLQEHP
jgi:hypothetical protein